MRYYFHIALNGDVVTDHHGEDLPSYSDVQCSAIDMAQELARELPRPAATAGYYIEVMDETGKCVFALPIFRDQDSLFATQLRRIA